MKPASNLCIVLCLPLLHACTGIGAVSGNMPLKVESVPSGATVTIMDKNLGETPLRITQQQIYPAAYDPAQQQRYGEILIKKKGCRDYRKRISYRDFNQGLTVELDCGDAETDAKANGHQRDRTIKQRLIRLDNLKRDGLISEEEYRQARERILEAL
ncbi:MAG: PEGA domain-containing protein [Candidatus Thiodiazotropha sp. (ex Dulcina madagascariensis)]|nr:PEGA domain-containing protein [Candidatus Thiodiazotropha sp. (ex Dulcina madagascariensis)]